MKFHDAAIIINGSFKRHIDAIEITSIRKSDEYKYNEHIKPYLYCPECKTAKLTHCNGDIKQPYFRLISSSHHDEKCSYIGTTLSPRNMNKIYNKNTDNLNFSKRLHRIIGLLFHGNNTEDNPFEFKIRKNDNINHNAQNNEQIANANKTYIPRRLITRLSEEDMNTPKIFYGNVFIKWINSNNIDKIHYIAIYRDYQKNYNKYIDFICRIRVTNKVYINLPLNIKTNQHCHIAFLSKFTLNEQEELNKDNQKYIKKYFNTYLKTSNYLAIETIDLI